MSSKEDILSKYRKNIQQKYDMPSLDDIKAITYPDPLVQFITMTESVGGHVIEVKEGQNVNDIIKGLSLMPRRLPRTCQRLRLPRGIQTT
jgi:L-lactate dehydrogenase complex protein LldG